MIRKLFLFLFVLALIYLCSCLFSTQQTRAQSSVTLKAGVGKYYFTASGIVSPYASVVMTTALTFMASTVADDKGNFKLEPVLVNEGFTDFCIEAVDIRRIGNSYTCFKSEPADSDFEKENIFLPPTVGLSGRKITPNSSILASGYSMPNASVKVNLGNGIILDARSHSDGYYKTEIKDIPVGTYELYATANYESKDSEIPTRKFKIEAISFISSIPVRVWILILVLPVLVMIILFIILRKRRRKKGSSKQKKS